MKLIGFIHKYSPKENKGILVYGYIDAPFWNSPSPILFTSDQCITAVKTGILVYFTIDDNNIVSNIEHASILNFDREIMLHLIAVFDSKNWIECKKTTQIRYQNIGELQEFYRYESDLSNVEPSKEDKEDSVKDDFESIPSFGEDFLSSEIAGFDEYQREDEILEEQEMDEYYTSRYENSKLGEYRKITIPNSIDEEYLLFGKQFASWQSDEENHYIYVDLLNPNLWILPIPKSKQNYFGKDSKECIELFDILVSKERTSHEKYLSRIRNRSYYDYLRKLNPADQSYLCPELFINNSVSSNWRYLIERLSDEEIMVVLNRYPLLQPILPIDFCKRNIGTLTENYGFPSVGIANLYLTHKINNIKTATQLCDLRNDIHIYKNCKATHPIDEGTFLCALSKNRLDQLSRNVERKVSKVLNYVKNQIIHTNSTSDLDCLVDWNNTTLILSIGRFLDLLYVLNKPLERVLEYADKIVSEYNDLPDKIGSILNTFISIFIKERIKLSLSANELSPYAFHYLITAFSLWLNDEFVFEVSDLLLSNYSKIACLDDLKDAYRYNYITETIYVDSFFKLTENFTSYELINELYDHFGFTIPNEIQLHILRSKVKELDLNQVVIQNRNSKYICTEHIRIYNIYDFLQWIKEESSLTNPNVSKIVYLTIQDDIISQITSDNCWYLFERELLYSPGKSKIKSILSNTYTLKNFKAEFLTRDCFQSQIAKDVLKFSDLQLIISAINTLNPNYRKSIADTITGFGKVYIWSLDPNANIDLQELRKYFVNLPTSKQKIAFRYLFKLYSEKQIKVDLLQYFTEILETQTTPGVKLSENDRLLLSFDLTGNIYSALYALIIILKAKLKSPELPIKYSSLNPPLTLFKGGYNAMFRALSDFFVECKGWLLLSYESQDKEYFTRNGYVTVNDNPKHKGYIYKICFYETPLDYKGHETNYLDDSNIRIAEDVLKKNFKFLEYKNENNDNMIYLIHKKDKNRLKEYVIQFDIEDHCNLFNETIGFHEDQIYGIPEHTNFPTLYERNNIYICNCGLYKDIDPTYGIPFRWCMKNPCTRRFNFLSSDTDWEKYKFVDFLRILTKGKISINQLWIINYEVSSFLNRIHNLNPEHQIEEIESYVPKGDDEIGVWTSEMSIFTYESCDCYYGDYGDYGDDEETNQYYDQHHDESYDRYNGSWAQDSEQYSDDDIDTIFDGDPDAYWNID